MKHLALSTVFRLTVGLLVLAGILTAADVGIVPKGLSETINRQKFTFTDSAVFTEGPLRTALMNSTFRISGNGECPVDRRK